MIDLPTDSTFNLALASTLNPDGVGKEGAASSGGWRADIEGGLADDWEYVMYGKVNQSVKGARSAVPERMLSSWFTIGTRPTPKIRELTPYYSHSLRSTSSTRARAKR